MFRLSSGLYFSACLRSLFLSILCTCCSHFSWYCFIFFIIFCVPVFSLIHWFSSLSNFVIPSKCRKNFICAASKRCSSLFFSTQASLPNFNSALRIKEQETRLTLQEYDDDDDDDDDILLVLCPTTPSHPLHCWEFINEFNQRYTEKWEHGTGHALF